MDEDGFRQFLIRGGRKSHTVDNVVKIVHDSPMGTSNIALDDEPPITCNPVATENSSPQITKIGNKFQKGRK